MTCEFQVIVDAGRSRPPAACGEEDSVPLRFYEPCYCQNFQALSQITDVSVISYDLLFYVTVTLHARLHLSSQHFAAIYSTKLADSLTYFCWGMLQSRHFFSDIFSGPVSKPAMLLTFRM